MLVSSKELFKKAQKNSFAFPAPNFIDQLTIQSYVEVAEGLDLPIILDYAEVHTNYLAFEDALNLGKYYGKKADVPVVLHFDHGTTKKLIKKAIDKGFTSVMIDASKKSFEVNVKKTKEIVEYAHLKGVVVEAEIGHVGGSESSKDKEDESIYTEVEEAKKFVELTNVDSLAVSIGTSHGTYQGEPKINFERLEKIRNVVDIPLVLHGGSSSGDDNLRKCAKKGINKVNIFTDLVKSSYNQVQEDDPGDYHQLKASQKTGIEKSLKHFYNLLQTHKYKSN